VARGLLALSPCDQSHRMAARARVASCECSHLCYGADELRRERLFADADRADACSHARWNIRPCGDTDRCLVPFHDRVPNPITVSLGTSIKWINNDNVAHTVSSQNNLWDSGNVEPGATFSRTFQSTGSFPYYCVYHPLMVGTITVQ
jgi:hypothetical protein